jgi:hypothetical protein
MKMYSVHGGKGPYILALDGDELALRWLHFNARTLVTSVLGSAQPACTKCSFSSATAQRFHDPNLLLHVTYRALCKSIRLQCSILFQLKKFKLTVRSLQLAYVCGLAAAAQRDQRTAAPSRSVSWPS